MNGAGGEPAKRMPHESDSFVAQEQSIRHLTNGHHIRISFFDAELLT